MRAPLMKRPPSRTALLRHQTMLLRTLADLRAGRNCDHLAPEELAWVMAGLEQRLVEVNAQIEGHPQG